MASVIELFDGGSLADWLTDKPHELACTVAARIALRLAPLLKDSLLADEEVRRTNIVLPGFRALAAVNFAAKWPNKYGEVRQAAKFASHSVSENMRKISNEVQVNLFGRRQAVPYETLHIHEIETDANAVDVAARAIEVVSSALRVAIAFDDVKKRIVSPNVIFDSVIDTVSAAIWAVDSANGHRFFRAGEVEDGEREHSPPEYLYDFWEAVERDLVHVQTNLEKMEDPEDSVTNLSNMALWMINMPNWVYKRWDYLRDGLPGDEGWNVWVHWYESCLSGEVTNSTFEADRLNIAETDWMQGPEHVNSIIEKMTKETRSHSINGNSSSIEDRIFDVALSFAGEQREYVEEVARCLAERSIGVFYDGFLESWLWGRNLSETFHEIFAEKARYVVMFVSAEYVKKPWTRHERQSALSRQLEEESEYVLPVRFDNTSIPGLQKTINYLNADDYKPAELAAIISEKLGVERFDGKASDVPPPRMTSPVGEVVFDYSNFNGRYIIGSGKAIFETQWTKASSESIHIYNDPDSINGVALDKDSTSIYEVTNGESLNYSSRSRTPQLNQIVVLRNKNGFYAAIHVLDIKDDTRGDSADQLRFRYAIETDGSDNFEKFQRAFEDE